VDPERYPFTPLLGYVPQAAAPVERLIERMDACGVQAAVLVQPSYYGYDHRYLQESLARYPHRLRGVGLADPFVRPPAFAAGCVGVRLNAVGHPGRGWLGRTAEAGFWQAVAEAGLVLCVQADADQVGEVVAAARAHPAVRCVLDHLGRGAWDDLREAASVPNLFLKVSGMGRLSRERYPHRDVWPAVARAVADFGPERCLWGSDANGTDLDPYRAQVELWRDLFPLGPAARAEILAGTAHRLFFGPAGPA
jgi:predicted TIM-barrel fold metal-dependent hydrolase